MTEARLSRRRSRSGFVMVLFVAAAGVLFWTWTSIHRSSAAFADQETFAGNHLGTGTVDVEVGAETVRFEAENMAAGDVATGQLQLLNSGSFPIRYTLSVTTAGGPLGDVLELAAWTGAPGCTDEPPTGSAIWRPALGDSWAADRVAAAPLAAAEPQGARLAPDDSRLLCMRALLPLSAPSSVQGERLDLVITVTAEHDVDGAP